MVEWLEDFKSQYGEYVEAKKTIEECESVLEFYRKVVDPLRIPLLIQNARNARRADGSCLEYGLVHHLKTMNGQLDKGLPADPRFPERDYQWIDELTQSKDKLLEWLEGFKSQYNMYEQAWPTIEECELILQKYNQIVQKIKIPIEIQKARNAKRAQGSVLEFGLDYHLRNFSSAVRF